MRQGLHWQLALIQIVEEYIGNPLFLHLIQKRKFYLHFTPIFTDVTANLLIYKIIHNTAEKGYVTVLINGNCFKKKC
ncbi:hypothetical protein SAMN05216297_12063 [Flavobacterium phragmitis]|uniref:Uncharacterized protein n=1 Tax=Flavobacterium phragmitis TaxID=739143 RepID=A0A1I1XQJ1_9FLAO|nr:hypothetical protein SAMN05216297_12063 [Flavobacterium phragmitis]